MLWLPFWLIRHQIIHRILGDEQVSHSLDVDFKARELNLSCRLIEYYLQALPNHTVLSGHGMRFAWASLAICEQTNIITVHKGLDKFLDLIENCPLICSVFEDFIKFELFAAKGYFLLPSELTQVFNARV